MLSKLKKRFPALYAQYQHYKRLKFIKQTETLRNLPESQYPELVAVIYKQKMGHELDWANLQTYTEKMQWEKIYDKNPMKTVLADKYLVREWIAEKIGEDYLIPILGCWDQFDDIDFSLLPNQFVLKTNHGSGTNVIVKDKSTFNKKNAKRCFDDWMKTDFAFTNSFELHYSDIPRKIIAEKYMETALGELQDYKFLCFDGVPYFCWVDLGRYSKHTRTVFDMEWHLQPWTQASYGISSEPIPKPENFEKMIEIAGVLSQGFSHVRVDLYNVDGKIYFGEMTFTNGGGLDPIVPESYDLALGALWNLIKDDKES